MLMISDLDLELTQELKIAKGYEFKLLFTVVVDKIGSYLQLEVQQREKVGVLDIADFCISYNLTFKTCTEILEELKILPEGTFLTLRRGGLNVGEVMAEARRNLDLTY
ncbi:MAG: hypothetical protein ACK4WN_00310 [Aphanizomenon sp.]|jgi:hypothetical protein